jgi:hypothetical protein
MDVRVDTMNRHKATMTRKRVSGVRVTEKVDNYLSAYVDERKG